MTVTTKTIISFDLSRESEAYERFKKEADADRWRETLTSNRAYFTQTTITDLS